MTDDMALADRLEAAGVDMALVEEVLTLERRAGALEREVASAEETILELTGTVEERTARLVDSSDLAEDLAAGLRSDLEGDEGDRIGRPPVQVALARVIADVRHVGKDRTVDSSAGGYAYRAVDDLYDAVHEAFAAHGVIPLPDVLLREAKITKDRKDNDQHHVTVKVRVRFVGPRGDELDHITYGEGLDYRDRATQKAITDAFKYALLRAMTIPVTDDASDEGAADPRTPEIEELAEFIAEALAAELPADRVAAGVAFAAASRDNLARARRGLATEIENARQARGGDARPTHPISRGQHGPHGRSRPDADQRRTRPASGLERGEYAELNIAGVDDDLRRRLVALVTAGRDEGAVSSSKDLRHDEAIRLLAIVRAFGHSRITIDTAGDRVRLLRYGTDDELGVDDVVSAAADLPRLRKTDPDATGGNTA